MKYIIRVVLLFFVACCTCACIESESEKLKKLSANITHNTPLIIESVKQHKVDYEVPSYRLIREEIGKNIQIHSVEEFLLNFHTTMTTMCILQYSNPNACQYTMNLYASSTDNNTWIVEVLISGGTIAGVSTTHSFKILKDKKRIAAMNYAACQALDVNLADLLEKKSKTEQVDWEKLCSFPIKFVKGVK